MLTCVGVFVGLFVRVSVHSLLPCAVTLALPRQAPATLGVVEACDGCLGLTRVHAGFGARTGARDCFAGERRRLGC